MFKLVPMLNPDGVIVGNYRTNLAARDLNRTYKDPKKVISRSSSCIKRFSSKFLMRYMIGLKKARHFFIQSQVILKLIVTRSYLSVSRALRLPLGCL